MLTKPALSGGLSIFFILLIVGNLGFLFKRVATTRKGKWVLRGYNKLIIIIGCLAFGLVISITISCAHQCYFMRGSSNGVTTPIYLLNAKSYHIEEKCGSHFSSNNTQALAVGDSNHTLRFLCPMRSELFSGLNYKVIEILSTAIIGEYKPSKKSRYSDREPSSPIDMHDLRKHLNSFSKDQLVEILWLRSQYDRLLWKAISAFTGMQLANGDFQKAKEYINFALYFPDFIRYTEHGHSVIMYKIINALDILYEKTEKANTLQIADYILKKGHAVLENFEDSWEWFSALEHLEKWIHDKKSIQ